MPARSNALQKAVGAALAAKREEADSKDLKGASREMHDTMTEQELVDFASTLHDDLPDRQT